MGFYSFDNTLYKSGGRENPVITEFFEHEEEMAKFEKW